MDTINSSVDFNDLFNIGMNEQTADSSREQEIKTASNQDTDPQSLLDSKTSCKQESKGASGNDIKSSNDLKPERRRGRPKKSSPDKTNSQDNKRSRIVDQDGITRRPANMTLIDEYRIKLNMLAAKRLVQPWKLLNEAIRRYLVEEGELKE